MPARRYRYSWDEIAGLDADHMAGWGAFRAGTRETVDFDDDDLPVLAFEMGFDEAFVVYYQWRAHGQKPGSEFVRSRVCLDRRPCRLGGARAYFIGPCCGTRTLRLAVLPEGLRCRVCGRVTWACRREQPIQRLIRRATKVAHRLRCERWDLQPTTRPPYMRYTEFERLKRVHGELVDRINISLTSKLIRKGHLGALGYLARL